MVRFSKDRLEGRALEAAFAEDRRRGIHMHDPDKGWVAVRTAEALKIQREMKSRAREVKAELKEQGMHILAADCPIVVECQDHSVDLRVWVPERQTEALIELKWTRQSLHVAMAEAKKCSTWQRSACISGKWLSKKGKTRKVGKSIKAKAFGALAVGPDKLVGSVTGYKGVARRLFFQELLFLCQAAFVGDPDPTQT